MIMPISWQYTDVFGVIIWYQSPKVIIRFTLKNNRNNLRHRWAQFLEGEILEDLFDGVYETIEAHKLNVWQYCF